MNTLAFTVDLALYALGVLTFGLIIFKSLDLLAPTWIGKASLDQRLGSDANELSAGMEEMESWLTVLAVIATAAPFIGLVGTVMHIIEALRNMGTGTADMTLIGGPIATALNSTLVGLASAIPAAISHALFQRKLQVVENQQRRKLGA